MRTVSHAQVIATFGRFTRIEWPKGFEDQVIHRLRYVSLDIFTFLVSSRLVEPLQSQMAPTSRVILADSRWSASTARFTTSGGF